MTSAVAIAAIVVMSALFYQIHLLWRNHAWQQNQILFVNSRLNNVRECIKVGDKECPENKYVDSRPYLGDESTR